MKKKFKMIFAVIVAVLLFLSSIFLMIFRYHTAYSVSPLSYEKKNEFDLEEAKNLMIVAHPDDESLWGGSHLMDGGYFVVCLTHGNDKKRSKEFKAVMRNSCNQGLLLYYPDKVFGRRDNWEKVEDSIEKDINQIIQWKNWDMIVTHNENGEYGHIHHKKTHDIVVGQYKDLNCNIPLYCFGKYYTAKKVSEGKANEENTLSDEKLKAKEKLLSLHLSQERVIEGLSHMNPYENWILYSENNGGN